MLADPSAAELTRALGFPTELEPHEADLVVVGAGPAGLSAAVYGSSEGLRTTVLDGGAVGGQAGSSSLIRNYLGFPRGLGGGELAQRAYQQAWLFGTRFRLTERVVGLERTGDRIAIRSADGVEVTARAVVLALGVEYRRLDAPGLAELEGAGVYYGASMSEAQALAGEPVFVVGGGNSAGQAALHLARYARQVTILVRRESLAETMSRYLIDAIEETPNVAVRYRTEVAAAEGAGSLERLELREAGGEAESLPAAALVILIGARPRTELVAGGDPARHLGVPPDGRRRARRREWKQRLAARAKPAAARDERSGSLCGGRRARRLRQARRRSCRRRRHGPDRCPRLSLARGHGFMAQAALTRRAGLSPAVALLALPLVGLALLLALPAADLHWQHNPAHFWLVLIAASLNVILAYSTGAAARRRGDGRVHLVSLAFLAAAAFLGLHALATPGVLLDAPNLGFAISTPTGLVLAGALAAASALDLDRLGPQRVLSALEVDRTSAPRRDRLLDVCLARLDAGARGRRRAGAALRAASSRSRSSESRSMSSPSFATWRSTALGARPWCWPSRSPSRCSPRR